MLSDFINFHNKYYDGTQLIAPVNHKGVLEAFLSVSEVKFELKHHTEEHRCEICGLTHKITDIPIKAMFRDSEVFKHEAYFADLLWNAIWNVYLKEFCKSFSGKAQIKISESNILRREVKSKEVDPTSRWPLSSYDYIMDLFPIGRGRRVLFDLTTGLWKKSGFHEIGKSAEEYVETWRELLFNIPRKTANTYAVWYIVVNATEEKFFDETSPGGAKNMDELISLIAPEEVEKAFKFNSESDLDCLDLNMHKIIVVPVFNSTTSKGEARWEIKRLEGHSYDKTLIWKLVNRLIA